MTATQTETKLETHATRIQVRWDELDSNGHVNNKYFQGYLDEARMQAMRSWNLSMQTLREQNIGPVITGLCLKFKKEVHYPEALRIESRLRIESKTRAVFVQEMLRESDGALACTAETEWVLFDLQRRRPVSFYEYFGEAITSVPST